MTRFVGSGGQGDVYEYTHRETGASVAVKVSKDSMSPRHRRIAAARLEREVTALMLLNGQPHIVDLLTHGVTEDGRTYVVTSYVQGAHIDEYVRNQWQVDSHPRRHVEMILRLIAQTAKACHIIHQYGTIHRDIKPSNILVDSGASTTLIDFGMCKMLDLPQHEPVFQTAKYELPGTPAWATPEHVGGAARVSCASDQYSLAVVLFQLLTAGGFPHNVALPTIDFLVSIVKDPPTSLFQPFYPEDLGATRRFPYGFQLREVATIAEAIGRVVHRALAKDPSHRYATTLDFAHALEALLI